MAKNVSLKDVATHVGVSPALVSYVLNGKEKEARVGAAMAEKIRKAAKKLHYQPNMIAKSLKMGRSNTIGLIVADISSPFFSSIARIIEDEAKKKGYVVIFGSSDEKSDKQQDLITVFLNRQVDAFIIAPAMGSEAQIKDLQKKKVPVVLIDRYFPDLTVDCVHIDNYLASYTAVEQLIKNGRKKIAMVSYENSLLHMKGRREGYLGALKAHKLPSKKEWLIQSSHADITGDVNRQLSKLLSPLKVDAVMFATDSLAVAGLKCINKHGIKIPQDLALISFDESDVFDFFYSPVSFMNQSLHEMGREAVQLASHRVENKGGKPVDVIIPTKLVIQESCGTVLKP